MGQRWATYTCASLHLEDLRPFPYISAGGRPSVVFDSLHTMERHGIRHFLPNATEVQRREHMEALGWVYDVVERWGESRFECRREWLCPWHADPENRDRVAGAYAPAAAPATS